jgi:hypothetical protein
MKTSTFILSLLLLVGCQAKTPAPFPPAVAAVPPALNPSPPAGRLRAPEVVKTYTIGAYVDPADPTLRHEAHAVQRIEAAAYWDLRPAMDVTARPVTSAGVPKAPAAPAPAPEIPTVEAGPVPAPVELTVDPEPALMPNGDGVIDLTAADVPAAGEVNPFAVRVAPAAPPRSIELRVTGIIAGAKPGAIINGQLLEPGGAVEGLLLKHIEPGGVILTFGRHRLRVPLSSEPIRVRTAP